MSRYNDLGNRVAYALGLAVIGLACLLIARLTTAVFLAALTAGFVYEVISNIRDRPKLSMNGFLVTLVFALICITGFISAFLIRTNNHGVFDLLLVALGVVATDSFAYLGGKKFGKRKLVPNISPNKTVEGLICGLIAGIIVLWITWGVLKSTNNTSLDLTGVICLMALPPVAVLGDLLESQSKRLLDIKDFGTSLGAHGGIADRFDAMTAGFLVFLIVNRIS